MAFKVCAELIGEKERGEALLKRVKDEGDKQIVDIKISTLKQRARQSLLDYIVGTESKFDSSSNRPIIIVPPSP